MTSLRTIALVAAASLSIVLEAAAATAIPSCSDAQLQQLQTQVAGIRASLESDAHSSNEATNVPATCKAALTFDLSAASVNGDGSCANDCIAWIEDVVDSPTCGNEEMLTYQRRMAAYLTQCNDRKRGLQDTDVLEHNSRLRGLAAGLPEPRQLGVKGLMDALLVVTLNNAL